MGPLGAQGPQGSLGSQGPPGAPFGKPTIPIKSHDESFNLPFSWKKLVLICKNEVSASFVMKKLFFILLAFWA